MTARTRQLIAGALLTLFCVTIGVVALTAPPPHPGNPAVVPVPSPLAPAR